ncbi:cbb3-type cytochrome c oxidase subunit I [Candidatus Carsonella ruddii]|uniref:Cytochrome O ubiquinol oxidase subunit I n=1 Tax=Candidatus Carsonella ruddii PC isolate NHV TaxID=1202540 RepID=J3VR45_CARRU|nr:cbb3-type cytochrome c oxidase subunit I [Candidatus Carsonella ruddii]AFP84396.1 cytochrome O ubiquinol oxidase subunit I [Candidatus Carsonella ruddii PC isolate NHV]
MININWNIFPINEFILTVLFLLILITIIIILPFKIEFFKKIKNYSTTFNHKKIGKIYLFLSFLMMFRGLTDAILIRLQQILCYKHKGFLSDHHYCQIFTAHGDIMIFFVAMPMLIGIMNIIIPLQIGSKDVAFPSLNLLSFWLTFFSTLLINISLIVGEFAKTGWLGYPPLSEKTFSPWVGVDYWDWSIQISGIGTIISSINFITTILKLRKKNLFFNKLSIFIWTCLCSNILILISFPILTVLLFQIFLDRNLNTHFYSSFYGGQQMLYINLIWAWGHPEVYILILPSFGIFSEIISYICIKNVFSYISLIYATISITVLSFLVWLHHFFTMGSGYLSNIFFSISTMIIAIPTGVKIFNWIFTILFSNYKKNILFFWFLSFILIFSIGGFSGIILSIPNLDFIFHNSMFLIAHFHSVIIGGVLFGYLSGLNLWYNLIYNNCELNNIFNFNILFWLIGVILTFFPFYLLGYCGMIRRINIYYNIKWEKLLFISFFGSILILIAIIFQLISFMFFKNKKNINCERKIFRSSEFLYFNNFLINNYNEFYYKKKYIENIFYITSHNKSYNPFLISLFFFFTSFFLIWKKIFYFKFFFLILIIYIIMYFYE